MSDDSDIADLLRSAFGASVSIVNDAEISHRTARVARLTLTGAPVQTVIAKTYEDDFEQHPDSTALAEFQEELIAHRFLDTLNTSPRFSPRLLASNDSAMIFNDLGPPRDTAQRPLAEATLRLATSVAHLHCQTRPHLQRYHDMRHSFGLPARHHDDRRYGTRRYNTLFEQGAAFALSRFELTIVRDAPDDLRAEIDVIRQAITHPAQFTTLIHDDLGNARQMIDTDDGIQLLDFEYAKQGHCLLDFTKAIIGKFEINMNTGVYLWTGETFGLDIYDRYRQVCAAEYDVHFADSEWRAACAAALGFTALALVGRLCLLEPNRQMYGTVSQNMRAIVGTMHRHFNALGVLPALSAFAQQFEGDK